MQIRPQGPPPVGVHNFVELAAPPLVRTARGGGRADVPAARDEELTGNSSVRFAIMNVETLIGFFIEHALVSNDTLSRRRLFFDP